MMRASRVPCQKLDDEAAGILPRVGRSLAGLGEGKHAGREHRTAEARWDAFYEAEDLADPVLQRTSETGH